MNFPQTPWSADLSITHRCNLRCKYCSHFSGAGDIDRDLPAEEWLKFFEELGRCKVMTVTLQGGEPFIRKDLEQLVNAIVHSRMRFNILSNGTLITDQIAGFLASSGRCDGVQVSVDGSTANTHDAFRGEGSFQKAVRGIELLQKHGVPVTVRVTIHRQNVEDLVGIAKLLLEDIELPAFSTNAASYMGLCRQNFAQVLLTPEERTQSMEVLLKLKRKYKGRIGANAGPLAEAISWQMMEDARRERTKQIPGGGYLTGCSGPLKTIAVRADGVMVPCIQMSHIELGRINTDDLQTIWQKSPKLMRLRDRRNTPLSDFEFCRGCRYISYCSGNCPALAYLILGDENHPSPDACLKRFLESGGRLPPYARN